MTSCRAGGLGGNVCLWFLSAVNCLIIIFLETKRKAVDAVEMGIYDAATSKREKGAIGL